MSKLFDVVMNKSKKKDIKILITGGSGYLGNHLVETLINQGYEVKVFDTQPPKFNHPNLQFIQGDINNSEKLVKACSNINTVYHFAALADLDKAKDNPLDTMNINVMGTLNLLEASKKQKVNKIIFSSSIYVHSRTGGFYRVSKHSCELLLQEYYNRFGLNYTILRFGTLYGPGADNSNSVYNYLNELYHKNELNCIGDGQEVREYIDVRDAAEISLKAIKDKYNCETLIITGNHRIRLKDLLEMIREISGSNINIKYGEGKPSHYKYSPYSYAPQAGKKLTLEYYRDLGQGLVEVFNEIERKLTEK
jgi:UDP-glucose 4-epimerase